MIRKVLVYVNVFLLGGLAFFFLAKQYPEVLTPDIKLALDECLVEVEKGCPMLMGYAIDLEKQNAKLNRQIKTTCLCAP